MIPTDDELPAYPWTLPAPESQVLLSGPETNDAWALKLAVLELVARRALRLVRVSERRFVIWSRPVDVLAPGPSPFQPGSQSLRAVMAVYNSTRPHKFGGGTVGVPVERLAREIFTRFRRGGTIAVHGERWGWSGGGYVQAAVLPALEARGYFVRERATKLLVFPTTRWELTPSGMTALTDLRRLLEIRRESFSVWAQNEPDRVRAFVQLAGPSLLLLDIPVGDLWSIQRSTGAAGTETDAFSVEALAGRFGPGPADGLDTAAHVIGMCVDRAWKTVRHSSGE